MTPAASVVVPSRGGAKRLPVLFAALTRQVTSDFEVIVVVDGDIDDSATVVETWRDRLPLRAVIFPENRGRSTALNAGFVQARGGVLIRCDDDLEPHADWVSGHIAAHAAEPPLGVIGLYRNVFPDTPYARVYGESADHALRAGAYATSPDRRWRYWAGNVSVTRQTYDRVGDYDTRYRTYGWEDVDWGYRLHRAGVPIRLIPQLETTHHSPSTSTRARAQRAFLSGAARTTFEEIHGVTAFGRLQLPHGLWGGLVRGLAARGTEPRLARMAGLVDGVLPHAPQWLGEKAVALVVEAAAIAGHQRPEPDRTIL